MVTRWSLKQKKNDRNVRFFHLREAFTALGSLPSVESFLGWIARFARTLLFAGLFTRQRANSRRSARNGKKFRWERERERETMELLARVRFIRSPCTEVRELAGGTARLRPPRTEKKRRRMAKRKKRKKRKGKKKEEKKGEKVVRWLVGETERDKGGERERQPYGLIQQRSPKIINLWACCGIIKRVPSSFPFGRGER